MKASPVTRCGTPVISVKRLVFQVTEDEGERAERVPPSERSERAMVSDQHPVTDLRLRCGPCCHTIGCGW